MGCNSIRIKLPQTALGQTSIPTFLGNFGQVNMLKTFYCELFVGRESRESPLKVSRKLNSSERSEQWLGDKIFLAIHDYGAAKPP